MRRAESKTSIKKNNKIANNSDAIDLNSICIRINEIIERSNAIDNQLSQFEEQITTNKIAPISIKEDTILKHESISPVSNSLSKSSSSPRNSAQTSFTGINSLSSSMPTSYHESQISKMFNNSIEHESQISLNDLYKLMLEMKQQITEIARNQEIMKEEIRQISLNK